MQLTPFDLNTWPRRDIYEFFSALRNPFYMVTFRQDVTALRKYTNRNSLSFYYAMVYLCTRAINEVPAFRLTCRDGALFTADRRDPSFTDLPAGSEAFKIITLPAGDDLAAFCRAAGEKSRAQTVFIDQKAEAGELIYYSCLPWVDLTALTNEGDHNPDDTVPRISWGRYTEQGGRLTLGLSVEVNHRFIDGLHIGQFANRLDAAIRTLENEG